MGFVSFVKQKRVWVTTLVVIVIAVVVTLAVVLTRESNGESNDEPTAAREFPSDFIFGSGTSAYQVEGGWDADGKVPNIWDTYIHENPSRIIDERNADVSANSYTFYKDDVQLVKSLGLNFYRFSISWSRVMNETSSPNEPGLVYYDNLIQELIDNEIAPMITMYHWDLPQYLQNSGGWSDPMIVDSFVQYARILFTRYGAKVNLWITFNEPNLFCTYGYGSGTHAPGIISPGTEDYLCAHHVLLAHQRVYKLYKEEFVNENGKIGIAISSIYTYPKDPENADDVDAANRYMEFWFGWFANPIFSANGGYPQIMIDLIGQHSTEQGLQNSRLPTFSDQEKTDLIGSSDFLGLNYFTSYLTEPLNRNGMQPSYERDRGVQISYNPEWPQSASEWLHSNPEGLHRQLMYIQSKYNNPEVIISENGWSDDGQSVNDMERIDYLQQHFMATIESINHGCNVKGYTIWSLFDNFEWTQGYTERFGIFHVDFDNVEKKRSPKACAAFIKDTTETKIVPEKSPTDFEIPEPEPDLDQFPENFKIGCASASYQIEGAWNIDGKGENIWDTFTHTDPGNIKDNSNGDIATDSYNRYEEDVQLLSSIGAKFYRFSISWSRILSNGDISTRNQDGIDYYNRLINELIANKIEPMVTMYHWDLPQYLQDLGGWANPIIIDYFVEYADLLFTEFGDRVKLWSTFNEPNIFCTNGYGSGRHAPGIVSEEGVAELLCGHNVLLSHAEVYHMYQEKYQATQLGKVGIVIYFEYAWPKESGNANDIAAAERHLQFRSGWFANPIFSENGDYPEIMKELIDQHSVEEGRAWSRLPKFTDEQKLKLINSSDYLGLNYYTSHYVEPLNRETITSPSIYRDAGIITTQSETWPQAASDWLRSVPQGLHDILVWVKNIYGNMEVRITENGWSDDGTSVNDFERIDYLKGHFRAVIEAIRLSGCKVVSYAIWSIIDNFEWASGYTEKFGIFSVNFKHSSLRERFPKASVEFVKETIEINRIPSKNSLEYQIAEPPIGSNFPAEFEFGCASAAYQIEGAYNINGKGLSIWDTFTHIPGNIRDDSTGDIATDSYNRYKEDVQLLKELGVDFYRFSISWPRVLPTGDITSRNDQGIQYYSDLIDELLANDIQPMVTMYHWDLPQDLQDLGGWANEIIVNYFYDYADLLFQEYGNRVKLWSTFNEPNIFCTNGYGSGRHAPGIVSAEGVAELLCGHNVLLSHAEVYHMYQEKYQATQLGKVGIVIYFEYAWPKESGNANDIEAAERHLQFRSGWFANPIFSENGDYPEIMKELIDQHSVEEGRAWSRLPKFTDEQKLKLINSSDYLGLNYYTSYYVEPLDRNNIPEPSIYRDAGIIKTQSESWPHAASAWLRSVPQGLHDTLVWVKNKYDNIEVRITENGWSDDGTTVNDFERIDYLKGHFEAVIDAIRISDCNVVSYAIWSIIDNFEWASGYTEKFGIFRVDFDHATRRERFPKASVEFIKDTIELYGVPTKNTVEYQIPEPIISYFPDKFEFGCASAAYQIEGAYNVDSKGLSIWDTFTHIPGNIMDDSTGDIATDSYNRYKEDVQLLKELGVDFYRFSISWPRVLPTGDITSRNDQGIQYYSDLIDELLANDIQPMVTMYHWDLPQDLQDLGGWANEIIVNYFYDYADLLFQEYGNRVKLWSTFNEPNIFCTNGYGSGRHAPGIVSEEGVAELLCGHNVLLSHAEVYHMYQEKYQATQLGKVGIVIYFEYAWPKESGNANDIEAAERHLQFRSGWFANPIFSENGDYPEIMKELIDQHSVEEGRAWSRLPKFTDEQKLKLINSSDYLGLNYYTSYYVEPLDRNNIPEPSIYRDAGIIKTQSESWPQAASAWLRSVPQGLHDTLVWVKNKYDNIEVRITENGWSDDGTTVNDFERIDYLKGHFEAVIDAIRISDCNVVSYAIWSIIDNFEWASGYTEKFGIFWVHFDHDTRRERFPKASVEFIKDTIDLYGVPTKNTVEYQIPEPIISYFPDKFEFGCASAAYQIEGAYNVDGKGLSIWDTLTHTPGTVFGGDTGDVAADSYNRYKQDVQLLKDLGVNFYRFSISWPRVLPTGDISSRNQDGIDYYNRLINELIANNIEPMVTMYHWDLPQYLQDLGGWANEIIIDYFNDYADLLFDEYGDRVKLWTSFNEPNVFCEFGYGYGLHAPQILSIDAVADLLCGHNVLLSHAKVYRMYKTKYYAAQQGKVGIVIHFNNAWPKDENNEEDVMAAERYIQFSFGWFANAIFDPAGDYPTIMKQIIDENSEAENRAWSRLPKFTTTELTELSGSADFLGVNYYTTVYAEPGDGTSWALAKDANILTSQPDSWPQAASMWLRSIPLGLFDSLKWIKNRYNNPEIYITENGWSEHGTTINDVERIDYLKGHYQAILDAIYKEKCNVKGHTIWSIIDNFEWTSGYSERFGLYRVDFNIPQRIRIAKASVNYVKEVINDRALPEKSSSDYSRQFPEGFLFGSASASYQIEGAWNTYGKGPNIWDTFAHNPNNTVDGSNGDIASDSYHKYEEDVALMKSLGMHFYRFSISWARILPNGDIATKNPEGIAYYNSVIDELIRNDIVPMITMYHWDLPQILQDLGGWPNVLIADYFVDYARVLFEEFGDRVTVWTTFNEPGVFCGLGYEGTVHAPGIGFYGGQYLCGHTILLAHARVYELYKNEFSHQNGKIGIVISSGFTWPRDPAIPEHIEAAERALQFNFGWFGNPIFTPEGDYPAVMIERIDRISEEQGRAWPRLPKFTDAEKQLLIGSADFVGLNYYTSSYGAPSDFGDSGVAGSGDNTWIQSASGWLRLSPGGLRDLLNWIKDRYNNIEVVITENGWSDDGSTLNDYSRIDYLRVHFQEALDAVTLDGCNLTGYAVWSIIDNFEWAQGYSERFGIYSVDFEDDNRPRTAKASIEFIKETVASKTVPLKSNFEYTIRRPFPDDFLIGCASASYQIEGAYLEDGKGLSVWDVVTNERNDQIADHSTGNIAADSYHKYKEDVQLIKNLGMGFYRFSISWPRIMPTGEISSRNQDGIDYYHNLINELLANDIEPMVTMFHWDLPQYLQDLGGWTNSWIIDNFVDYARVLFEEYGDRVKYWNTFNEPIIFCVYGYGSAEHAPLIDNPGIGDYLCGYSVLLSHAKVYHMYKDEYFDRYGGIGKIGIALNSGHSWPRNETDPTHVAAADRSTQFWLGWWAHPIFTEAGDYPEIMKTVINERSVTEGRAWSRLPAFTPEEIELLKGSADFIGLNYYTSNFAEPNEEPSTWVSFYGDQDVRTTSDPSWPVAQSDWLRSIPAGLTAILNWIKDNYGNPEVIITENGWSDDGSSLDDTPRINYIRAHYHAVLDAIEDGCHVTGHATWSIIDNFEWMMGYTERFGIYSVNFNSPNRERTPKLSAEFIKDVTEHHAVPA